MRRFMSSRGWTVRAARGSTPKPALASAFRGARLTPQEPSITSGFRELPFPGNGCGLGCGLLPSYRDLRTPRCSRSGTAATWAPCGAPRAKAVRAEAARSGLPGPVTPKRPPREETELVTPRWRIHAQSRGGTSSLARTVARDSGYQQLAGFDNLMLHSAARA